MMKKIAFLLILMTLPLKLISDSPVQTVKSSKKENSEDNKLQKPLKIFALGDSNGALNYGWINQLKKLRPNDTIYKISISGNTIGFNNGGDPKLNSLANINSYMEKAYDKLDKIDEILIMIGTNDCKAVFKDTLSVVPENMRKLIRGIKENARNHQDNPTIFIISPPPFGPDEMLTDKYKGGLEHITWLNGQLQKISNEENVEFINTFQILLPVFKYLSTDGVHLNPDGQMMIALIIQENLKFFSNK
jgi:lysophospholipase L1-like esterase